MVASICFAVMPLAYRPPTMAPMLVPAMQSMGICRSSRTLRTPICAMPRAPPPDSTRQIRGRSGGSAAAQELAGHADPAKSAQARPSRRLSFPMWGASLVHDVDTGSSKRVVASVVDARSHEVIRGGRSDDGSRQLSRESREVVADGDGGGVDTR